MSSAICCCWQFFDILPHLDHILVTCWPRFGQFSKKKLADLPKFGNCWKSCCISYIFIYVFPYCLLVCFIDLLQHMHVFDLLTFMFWSFSKWWQHPFSRAAWRICRSGWDEAQYAAKFADACKVDLLRWLQRGRVEALVRASPRARYSQLGAHLQWNRCALLLDSALGQQHTINLRQAQEFPWEPRSGLKKAVSTPTFAMLA